MARARLFQKGLSSGPARARPGLIFLGLDPSLYTAMSFFDKGILLQEGSNLSMNYKMAETNGKTGHIDHAFYDKNKPTVYFW